MGTSCPSRRARETGKSTLGSVGYPTSCAALALLVLLALLGCAHQPPAPLSAEAQAQLGTIGVVAARFAPEVDYQTPGSGGPGGAAVGAAKGLGLGILGAAGCFLSVGLAAEACVLGVATPYLAVRYAVDQATQGVSVEEVAASEAAIKTALAERSLQEALRDQVLRAAASQPPRSFVSLPDQGPTQPSEAGHYGHLASQGVDAVLELTVQQIALRPHGGSGSGSVWSLSAADLNPWLALVATTRTRVLKVADSTELYRYTMERRGKGATFSEWGANDAQMLREALEQLPQDLAAEIMTQVFGVSVTPPSDPAAPTEPDPGTELEVSLESSTSDAEGPSE
jgi:hypothetical protein